MEQQATGKLQQMSIEATIIRADGSKEPLGVVSYWHSNPLMRWLHWIKTKLV